MPLTDATRALVRAETAATIALIKEEGIATRRHMTVVVARIRAKIRSIFERSHDWETGSLVEGQTDGRADPAPVKLPDR